MIRCFPWHDTASINTCNYHVSHRKLGTVRAFCIYTGLELSGLVRDQRTSIVDVTGLVCR